MMEARMKVEMIDMETLDVVVEEIRKDYPSAAVVARWPQGATSHAAVMLLGLPDDEYALVFAKLEDMYEEEDEAWKFFVAWGEANGCAHMSAREVREERIYEGDIEVDIINAPDLAIV
jgi:hypothetical protein